MAEERISDITKKLSEQAKKEAEKAFEKGAAALKRAIEHRNSRNKDKEREALEEAERHLKDAVELRQDYIEALVNLAAVVDSLGKEKEALNYCDHALDLNSENANAWVRKGLIFFHMGQYERATEYFEKALSYEKKNGEIYYYAALALAFPGATKKEHENALKLFDKALSLGCNDVGIWGHKVLSLVMSGHPQSEIIECYKEALRKYPENPFYWINLAAAYLTIFEFEKVREAAKNARKFAQKIGDEKTAENADKIADEIKEWASMEEAKFDQNNPIDLANRGAYLKRAGDVLQALQFFQRALELASKRRGKKNKEVVKFAQEQINDLKTKLK